MLLAVNIPEQEPQVGHDFSSRRESSRAEIWPFWRAAAAANVEIRSSGFPAASCPASIGPPEAKMVGMLQRTAAISMPGTILSQFGMQIMPSNLWAAIIDSTASAMISRLAREYFIPSCPMAIPSQMPIVLKTNGTPPAARTAFFTNSLTAFR